MLQKEVLEKFKQKLKSKPFDSDKMRQVPFAFCKEEEKFDKSDERQKDFAKKYFDMKCGYLHLGWDIDAYWTMVANKFMIPCVIDIYNQLRSCGYDEQHPCMYGDADGDIFWIPAKNPNTKVLVHTTQCRDYIYILTEFAPVSKPRYQFHIRRIWRNLNSLTEYEKSTLEDLYIELISIDNQIGSKENFFRTLLQNVSSIEEIADDHYQYSKRHSLEYYRQREFNIQDPKIPFNGIFGDSRDGGYVFSMDYCGRAEDTSINYKLLELISNCYLPAMACQLGLRIDNNWLKNNS